MHESGFGRVIGALTSPEKTFRSIAERPTWVVPLLLLVLVTALVSYQVGQRVDFERQIRQQMAEMAEQGHKVSEEDIQQRVDFMEKFGPILFLLPAVFGPIVYLILAAIFLIALRLSGSEIGFGQSFSVLLYGMVPWVVHSLLSLPLVLREETLDPEAMQQGGILMSNLAALAPEGSSKVLLALLASLDLFSIWTMVLLIIGYRAAARVSTTTATAVTLTLWLLYVAGKLGITAAFS